MREFLLEFAKKHNIEAKTDKIGKRCNESSCKLLAKKTLLLLSYKVTWIWFQTKQNLKLTILKQILFRLLLMVNGYIQKTIKTTLGADNGIGMAGALAALIDKGFEHGPLEALFTVDEETGLTGAKNVGEGMITGEILINLDSEDEAQIFLGCAGGIDTIATFRYKTEDVPAGYQFFNVSMLKFRGGHSGADIHLGRANANKLLARFLNDCYKAYGDNLVIANINGGELRNVIPGNAVATVGVPADKKEDLRTRINHYAAVIEEEYKGIEDLQEIKMESTDTPATIIDKETAKRVVKAIVSAPNAVIAMSRSIPGMVSTSSNLAL